MKIPSHFLRLYYQTTRRYKKLVNRLKKQISSGKFQQHTSYRQHEFLSEIQKLRKKLSKLSFQLKLAAAAGTMVLVLESSSVKAQSTIGPFTVQKRSLNPLRGPLMLQDEPSPAIVDLDNDGDYDLLVGEKYGDLRFFQNVGTAAKPLFDELTGTDNPFDQVFASSLRPAPAFADLDKDGDKDLFIGQQSGNIQYFENTGTAQAPAFTERTGTSNPLNGINPGGTSAPVFVDYDKDGDLDLFVGTDYGYSTNYQSVIYYQNNANVFTESSIGAPQTFSQATSVALADLDKDGDFEIISGASSGGLRLFTQGSEGYLELTGIDNPFDGEYIGQYTTPTFADFDGDADLDLIVAVNGSYYNQSVIAYFENKGNGTFEEKLDNTNPLGGIDVGRRASPVLLDYDGDGDLDALIGNKYGSNITYYKNDDGIFNLVPTADDPFDNIYSYGYFTPEFVDLDGDGDQDLITGHYNGRIDYFRNDGIINGKVDYNMVTTGTGPFAGIDAGYDIVIDLVDIDGDNDFDLLVGNGDGTLKFYRNTGTPQAPVFSEVTGASNPLSSIDYGAHALINTVDADHDGDYDLLIGSYNLISSTGNFYIDYYQNTGTPTAPVFVLGDFQFLSDFTGLPHSIARLFDLDLDGDLDAFIGTDQGHILYSKNENPAPLTTLTSSPLTLSIKAGDPPVVIDNQLTLADSDNDNIVEARITIEEYESGDFALTFTPQANITGGFDPVTGILTLKGKANLSVYQAALRTVGAVFPGGGGGSKSTNKTSDYIRNVSFQVYDIDYTTPTPASRAVTFSEGEIVVFNAVAPHSSGDNKWMRIHNLPAENKVTIYNRWGDKVYEAKDYDSNIAGKRFEGLGDNGKELATGTYFYKIESNSKTVTGYLSLKQ